MQIRAWTATAQDETLKNIVRGFGGEVEVLDSGTYEKGADIDIIFGSWKNRDVPHHNLKRDIVKNSKNVLVVETPLLDRGPQKEVMDDQWFRVGLNGFMRNAQYAPVNSGRRSFQLSQKSLSNSGRSATDYILVVLQLPGDASLDFIDINSWCIDTVKKIRSLTDRDIVIRYPQLDREFQIDEVKQIKDVFFQKGKHGNKGVTLNNAFSVVTYSSGMGVESILNGNRTFIESENGFWSRRSSLEEVLDRKYENFTSNEMAKSWTSMVESTQWHIDEIKSGACLSAFKELINGR